MLCNSKSVVNYSQNLYAKLYKIEVFSNKYQNEYMLGMQYDIRQILYEYKGN